MLPVDGETINNTIGDVLVAHGFNHAGNDDGTGNVVATKVVDGVAFVLKIEFYAFDKQLFTALMLAWSLPAPFIIPLFADMGDDAEYISTTLSTETIVSIILFIGVAAYSLA